MDTLQELPYDLPNICGHESLIEKAIEEREPAPLSDNSSFINFERINSACAIALHMHQPLIPAGEENLQTAETISNLEYMMRHQERGDNHNAPVFKWCYKRMGEYIPELVEAGLDPRAMLEYSGTLLFGLLKMGAHDVINTLRNITTNPRYSQAVEWLGAPWGHAVAPSTPIQDFRLHVKAFQHQFANLFGIEALKRIRGFSPSEMALPNHPDIAYEYIKTLRDCGYTWLLVQEHTVEEPDSGCHPRTPHIPHRLLCTNSKGESVSITAIVKTQGSDTKLVAQMQPWYEAKGLTRTELKGKQIPPLVTQIADGENGGVMMNEFPSKYKEVVANASGSETPLMNVTEYLEHLTALGITEEDLPPVQPLFQKPIWERFKPGSGTKSMNRVIEQLKKENDQFHVDGGSWTNNLSWVRGYENVLGPMEEASSLFYEKVLRKNRPTDTHQYRNALFHLLCSQTSCYRYWGQGEWTNYGRELCRRTREIVIHDF